jgi:hypothetical protein
MRNIYESLRTTGTSQSKKNKAAHARNRRNRTKRLLLEQLEQRMVMDAQLNVYNPFGSEINLLAKGNDAVGNPIRRERKLPAVPSTSGSNRFRY